MYKNEKSDFIELALKFVLFYMSWFNTETKEYGEEKRILCDDNASEDLFKGYKPCVLFYIKQYNT